MVVQAVRDFFYNYANFSGRTSRASYWYAAAGIVGAQFVVFILTAAVPVLLLLDFLAGLGLIIPAYAVQVRRLHDTGRSGWHALWALVPIAGPFVLLAMLVQPASPAGAVYGPYVGAPNSAGAAAAEAPVEGTGVVSSGSVAAALPVQRQPAGPRMRRCVHNRCVSFDHRVLDAACTACGNTTQLVPAGA